MATDQPRQFPVLTLTLTCSKDDSDVYGFDDDDDSDDGDDVDDDDDDDSYEHDDDDDDIYYVHVGLQAFIRPRAFTINSVATLIRPCVRKKNSAPTRCRLATVLCVHVNAHTSCNLHSGIPSRATASTSVSESTYGKLQAS